MKTLSQKTAEDVYLEYLNDYLTIKYMADSYNVEESFLNKMIDKGRNEHLQKFRTN